MPRDGTFIPVAMGLTPIDNHKERAWLIYDEDRKGFCFVAGNYQTTETWTQNWEAQRAFSAGNLEWEKPVPAAAGGHAGAL